MITNLKLKEEILKKIKCFYNKKSKEIFIVVAEEYAINFKIHSKEKRFIFSNEKKFINSINKQKLSAISLDKTFNHLFKDYESKEYNIPAIAYQAGTVLMDEFIKAVTKFTEKRKSTEPPKPCCNGG